MIRNRRLISFLKLLCPPSPGIGAPVGVLCIQVEPVFGAAAERFARAFDPALASGEVVCLPIDRLPMPDRPAGEAAVADRLHGAAARSDRISIACADRVGVDRGQPFDGRSPIAGLASCSRPGTLPAVVDPDEAARAKDLDAFNSLLRVRRADVHG